MTARPRNILIAGSRNDVTALQAPLVKQGFTVQLCSDGQQTLAGALEFSPDLLIVETDLAAIAADRLAQILRSNPRLRDLAIVFIGREGEQVEGFQRHRDIFLPRPFNREQLLTEVVRHFARRERARQVGGQEKEVTGNLQQISLVDLLQIFSLNHKSGILTIGRGRERGTLYLRDGRVVNARSGVVEGLKAFYRLLLWEEGKFSFSPGLSDTDALINTSTDHLIMEGLRQCDEMAAQSASLPARDAQLALRIPRERLPQGLRPATLEILMKLEYCPRVGDLLDQCSLPDFEILQVLRVLLEKGVVEQRSQVETVVPGHQSLLSPTEILEVRDRFGDREALLETATAKLVLVASDPAQVRHFLATLQGIVEFEPEDDFLVAGRELGPGDLGRLLLSETFALRLLVLPAAPEMAPLWTCFSQRVFGVAVLTPPGVATELEDHFRACNGVALAHVAFEPGVGAGFVLRRGDRQGLRSLLAFLARHEISSATT